MNVMNMSVKRDGNNLYQLVSVIKKFLLYVGRSSINEPPSSINFLSSRGIAFDSAILDAQKSYSEFRSIKTSEKINYKLKEGFGIENKVPLKKMMN